MRRWKQIAWVSFGLVGLILLVGSATSTAVAQVRAALVRETDSFIRGTRQNIDFSPNFPNSSAFASETITPNIPVGKKLVLQRIFINTALTNGQSPLDTRLILGAGAIGQVWVEQTLQGTSVSGQRRFTGSADIDVVLTAGESMHLFVVRSDDLGLNTSNFVSANVFGYLVDAN
jgi:hypothetical protein